MWGANSTSVFVGGVSPLNVFAGATLRRQGPTWVKTDDVRTTSMWGSSATDIWAAGDRRLRRWNGTQWQTVNQFNAPGQISAIHGSGPSNVWMVERTTIQRFDGTSFLFPPQLPSNLEWYAVHALGPNDVWVGGRFGELGRFDGTAWTRYQSGFSTGADVRGLWAAGPADVWAVGGSVTTAMNSAEVSRWNGTSWTLTAIPTAGALNGVWGSSANDVWAVGQGIVHYDGATWTRVAAPSSTSLNAVWGSAANDVWAVGDGGVILHFDGTAWTQVAPTTPAANVSGIWAASGTELFAVGRELVRSSGNGAWVSEPNPLDGGLLDVRSVHVTSANDVWAAGGSQVLHRTASGWASVALPVLADAGFGDGGTRLNDVFAVSPTEVWSVGVGGTVLPGNGASFTELPAPSGAPLNTVWAAGPNDVWVGGPGVLARWNGTNWVAAPGFTNGVVTDLWGTSATDIWAVGGSGVIINGTAFLTTNAPGFLWPFDGVTWARMSNGTTALVRVWASGSSVWAAGFNGDLRSFDGVSWTTTVPGADRITGLTSAGGTLWMVSGGPIIRGN